VTNTATAAADGHGHNYCSGLDGEIWVVHLEPAVGGLSVRPRLTMSNSSTSSHSQDDASASTVAVFYRELRRGCEKFVGPMPISQFFSKFVPEATEKRPGEHVEFGYPSISNHEDEFVGALTSKAMILALTHIADRCNKGVRSLSKTQICQHNENAR